MEVKNMDEQEEKNKSDGFFKKQAEKGKNALKDDLKKKAKQGIKKFILTHPHVVAIALLVILIVVVVIVFIAGALKIVEDWKESNTNGAKAIAVKYTARKQ